MKTMRAEYRGKIIYLGIGVHKRTYSVTAILEGQMVKRDTMAASPAGLLAYVKRCFAGAKVCSVYEAGFSGFVLHRELVKHGVENIVVNAALIEVAANDRVKTDRRDSRKLAEHLYAGRLKAIFVPEPEQRQITETGQDHAKRGCSTRADHRFCTNLTLAPNRADGSTPLRHFTGRPRKIRLTSADWRWVSVFWKMLLS
jgi:transposase